MSVHLLDVNVLIALVDLKHAHNARAQDWFGAVRGRRFATCPIVENGMIRIMSHASYPGEPRTASTLIALLGRIRDQDGYEFWPDDVSLVDTPHVVPDRLLTSAQITDTYLLALAVKRGGRLATLDRRLVVDAVRGGAEALTVV